MLYTSCKCITLVQSLNAKEDENMHIIIIINNNNNNSAPQGQRNNNNNNFVSEEVKNGNKEGFVFSSVAAAVRDVVFSFSSCAWSVGGYGDSQRSDEINRQNVWQRINASYKCKKWPGFIYFTFWKHIANLRIIYFQSGYQMILRYSKTYSLKSKQY